MKSNQLNVKNMKTNNENQTAKTETLKSITVLDLTYLTAEQIEELKKKLRAVKGFKERTQKVEDFKRKQKAEYLKKVQDLERKNERGIMN